MSESAKPRNGAPLERSVPGAPLESILCTEELHRRPSRPPDYEKENSALVALVGALADSPRTILHTLAETILLARHRGHVVAAYRRRDPARFRPLWRRARS